MNSTAVLWDRLHPSSEVEQGQWGLSVSSPHWEMERLAQVCRFLLWLTNVGHLVKRALVLLVLFPHLKECFPSDPLIQSPKPLLRPTVC